MQTQGRIRRLHVGSCRPAGWEREHGFAAFAKRTLMARFRPGGCVAGRRPTSRTPVRCASEHDLRLRQSPEQARPLDTDAKPTTAPDGGERALHTGRPDPTSGAAMQRTGSRPSACGNNGGPLKEAQCGGLPQLALEQAMPCASAQCPRPEPHTNGGVRCRPRIYLPGALPVEHIGESACFCRTGACRRPY